MEDFKIEKGIPVPAGKDRQYQRYPFAKMEVGDRIEVRVPDGLTILQARTRLHQAAYRHRRKVDPNWNFAVRVLEGNLYLWRIK